jgi:hypothetical protein
MKLVSVLRENKNAIVNNLEQESIDVYLFLKEQFEGTSNICDNHLYHFVFRSFYRLDNAGLTPEFKKEFFFEMQKSRDESFINIDGICRRLYLLVNRKGQNSLQYSFVTKLANTLDEHQPIYDSEVAAMYGFTAPYGVKDLDTKLYKYNSFYEKLKRSYKELVEYSEINEVFDTMHLALPGSDQLSTAKKLDFIMWSAGKLKRRKQLANV